MTIAASCRKLGRTVRWVCCLVVVGDVTSHTSVCRVVIIAVVTGNATNCNMGACQNIIVVMDRERSGIPVWVGGMASGAFCGNTQCRMIGIHRCVIIRCVATGTRIRSVCIISLVAGETIFTDGCMGAGERINGVVVKG